MRLLKLAQVGDLVRERFPPRATFEGFCLHRDDSGTQISSFCQATSIGVAEHNGNRRWPTFSFDSAEYTPSMKLKAHELMTLYCEESLIRPLEESLQYRSRNI